MIQLCRDLDFAEDVISRILDAFLLDPKLGIAGGDVFHDKNGQVIIESQNDPAFHVRGATKFYRRSCWEDVCFNPQPLAFLGWIN